MMKIMKEKMKKRKGFTLVELVVVIAILGILAAIAVPKLAGSRTSAANAAHNANVRVLESAATMYISEEGIVAGSWEGLGTAETPTAAAKYLQEWPKVPKGAAVTDANTDATLYTVTIKADGTIEVKPKAIDLNQ